MGASCPEWGNTRETSRTSTWEADGTGQTGHEGGPYVFVDITDETDLGQRLHMMAVGLDIARIGKVGCVWTWPASQTVPYDFHDIFRISEDAKTSGIAFTLVITDKMDSGTNKYYRDLRAERMATINDDVCYMEFMASLQSEAWPEDENMDWLAGAGEEPTSKWIVLQPWCEDALDIEYGVRHTWPDRWSDCYLVWLPSWTDLQKVNNDPALASALNPHNAEKYALELFGAVLQLLRSTDAKILIANATEAHLASTRGVKWCNLLDNAADQCRCINRSLLTPMQQRP